MYRLTCSLIAALLLATPAAAQESMTPAPPPELPDDSLRSRADENHLTLERLYDEKRGSSFNASGLKLAKGELKLLRAVEKAAQSADGNGGPEALASAKTGVTSAHGRFVLAALQLQIGTKRNDRAMMAEATDLAIDSGGAADAMMAKLLRNQASFALDANQMAKAEGAYIRLISLQPKDADATVSLAQIKLNMGKPREAAPLLEMAIALKQAAGQPVPDVWRRVLASAKQQAGVAAK